MSYARIRFVSKALCEKYGPIGYVASRYIEAGYSVRINHPTRYGPIHVLAKGKGHYLAIEVFDKPRKVPEEVVRTLAEKAKLVRAKPILVLYGDGPELSEDIYRLCKELNIKIRRIRAQ